MPTMSWNRVEGFEGNEARLGAQMSLNAPGAVRAGADGLQLLSERDYIYSDYYRPKGTGKEAHEEIDLDVSHDGAHLKAYADDQHHLGSRKKRPRVILPNSKFRRTWIIVQLFVVLYIIWVTPVRVGFDKPATGFWFWLEGIIDLFFYTDLVLNFFTAYEHPVTGELITDHRKIAMRYMRTWFIIDLLATFPVDYIVRGVEGTWTCSVLGTCDLVVRSDDAAASLVVMLRMLRFFRILWIFKNFNVLSISTVLGRLQDEFYSARWLISLVELLIVLVFLGHLSGCFFYFFSGPSWWSAEERRLINEGELSTWSIDKLGGYETVVFPTGPYNTTKGFPDNFPLPPANSDLTVEDPPGSGQWYMCPDFYTITACARCAAPRLRCITDFGFAYRYITSMYWAYTTMTTVGYGDIYGTTIAEKVWCMVTMVIGGFFLSFCFGRMASVISRLDADKVARGEQLHQLSAFMKDVELPRPLARKVLDYHKKQRVKSYDRQEVLARLPFELRSKILRHLYLPTIAQVSLLKAMSEDDVFLTDLCVRLQPTHFSADTFVYMRGESGADVFILLQGELDVLDMDQATVLFRIPEGTIFGEPEIVRLLAGHNDSGNAHTESSATLDKLVVEGISKLKRRDNVFCRSPCDMLRLPAADIEDLCEHYPALLRGLRKLDKARMQRMKEVRAAHANGVHSPSISNHAHAVPRIVTHGNQETSSLLHGTGDAPPSPFAGRGQYRSLAAHASSGNLGGLGGSGGVTGGPGGGEIGMVTVPLGGGAGGGVGRQPASRTTSGAAVV